MGNSWLLQDGSRVHFILTVRVLLNEYFPGHWIGRA